MKPIHGEPKPKDVPSDMQSTPPVPCDFKPGDRVIFTNDYGVQFRQQVRGFASTVWDGRFVYLDTSCWWFPKRPSQLRHADGVTVDARTCTCHPDDNPPRPCPRKFALSECRAAAGVAPTRGGEHG